MFSNHKLALSLFVVSSLGLAACDGGGEDAGHEMTNMPAAELAKSAIIADTHIDVPYRLYDKMEDVSMATEGGDFDYPRAVAGGLNAAFMSVYIPAHMEQDGTAFAHADHLIDLVEGIVASAPEKYALAYSVDDIRRNFADGKISLPMGMENGAPIDGNLANLTHFKERGITYVTLTHSLSNHISDSSYDDNKRWGGLSPFGEKVVMEMNRLGIMVDISHVSDDAFWDVMELTDVPAIASHSSARHYTPGFERNMNDEMIKRLASEGGVIQINFGSSFLTEQANSYGSRRNAAYEAWLAETSQEDSDELDEQFRATYAQENPYPYATLDETLDHFDHVVNLVGIDHVGVGSDYDGVGDSLPIGLKDVSAYPNLIEGLQRRGYSDDDIVKVLGENLLRVWAQVEAAAQQ